MLRMCVCMHSHFVENHPIRILQDGVLISEMVLSQPPPHAPVSIEELLATQNELMRVLLQNEAHRGTGHPQHYR
jgi:hypothetical protein